MNLYIQTIQRQKIKQILTKKAFTSPAKDYVLSLPNYSINHSTTSADYRVIVVVRHKKDNNDYYSFSTMEVIK